MLPLGLLLTQPAAFALVQPLDEDTPVTLSTGIGSLAAATPDDDAPKGQSCENSVIDAVVLEGCDAPFCQDKRFKEALIDFTGLASGQFVSQQLITDVLDGIKRLGLFKQAELWCVEGEDGRVAYLHLKPLLRVRKIIFKGNKHFYDSEIMDRLPLFRGDALDPSDRASKNQLEQAVDTIKRAYQEDGFASTEVSAEWKEIENSFIDVTFRIEEGIRVRVERFSFDLTATRTVENEGNLEQCPSISERDLRHWSGATTGMSVTEKAKSEVNRNLTRALRKIGFVGVKVEVKFEETRKRLVVKATYDSCYLIRFFDRKRPEPGRIGFKPVIDDSLLNALPFADSGTFDITEAELGVEEVRAWYENRGYLLADVVLDYRSRRGQFERRYISGLRQGRRAIGERPNVEFGSNVNGIITFLITKNDRNEIRKIRISGNKAISTARILEVMATKPYDFFGDAGAVLTDQVFYDLERIEALYRDEGFHHINFGGSQDVEVRQRHLEVVDNETVITYLSDGRAFKVRQPPDTSGVYLEISIDEGQQSRIGKITIDGVSQLDVSEVEKALKLHPGDPYSATRMKAARERVLRLYKSKGHPETSIEIDCAGSQEQSCGPQVPDQVDVAFTISEGALVRVGQVLVHGQRRTKSAIIHKDMPKPGEPYDAEQIARSVRSLNDLGVFDSVKVTPVSRESEQDGEAETALLVEVRENKSRFVDFVVGFEKLDDTRASDLPGYITSALSNYMSLTDLSTTGYGKALGMALPDILFSLEVRYTDLNFLGRAKRLYVPVKYGLSMTAWDRYASFTPTYIDPRFFAKGLALRVTPFAIYDRATSRLDQAQFGAEVALSKELFPRLYGALSFETGVINTRDPEITTEYDGWRFESKVMPTLTYDRLDHPMDPQNGGYLQASLAYINSLREGNFLKYELHAKGFITFRKLVTFGVSARVGGSQSFGAASRLPLQERFSLGGSRGVRGFTIDGIGQYNSDGSLKIETREGDSGQIDYIKPYGGDQMFTGSLEARFPILRSINLYGSLFYDFGALADEWLEFNRMSIRHSAGLGIRYLLAGMIPIRLDYGFIIDRRCRDVDRQTGACVQKEKVGNLHFGILYTF